MGKAPLRRRLRKPAKPAPHLQTPPLPGPPPSRPWSPACAAGGRRAGGRPGRPISQRWKCSACKWQPLRDCRAQRLGRGVKGRHHRLHAGSGMPSGSGMGPGVGGWAGLGAAPTCPPLMPRSMRLPTTVSSQISRPSRRTFGAKSRAAETLVHVRLPAGPSRARRVDQGTEAHTGHTAAHLAMPPCSPPTLALHVLMQGRKQAAGADTSAPSTPPPLPAASPPIPPPRCSPAQTLQQSSRRQPARPGQGGARAGLHLKTFLAGPA